MQKRPRPRVVNSLPPADWDRDVGRLDTYITRFVAFGRSPSPPWAFHPAFGQMKTAEWGILAYRHTAHHLAQFGA